MSPSAFPQDFIDHLGNYHLPSTYSPSTCPLASTAALPFSFVNFGLKVHNRFKWPAHQGQRREPLKAPKAPKALRENEGARLLLKPSLLTSTMRITTYAHRNAPGS